MTSTGWQAPAGEAPRLGLSSGALYPVPTEQVPALAAARGFGDLEIMLQTRGEYELSFLRDLAARCDANNCRVHAVHIWQDFHPLVTAYQRRTEEAIALFDQAIAGAGVLGARVIVWHGPKRKDAATPEQMNRFIKVAAERARACGAAGIFLGIENVSWCALATTRDVAAFASRLGELPADAGRWLGFVFDPFQAAEANQNPFMMLAAMGDRVVDVHLSDLKEGAPGARHLPPGDGDLPWPAILRAILAVYRGPLMLEGIVGAETYRLDAVRAYLEPLLADAAREELDPCGGAPPPGVLDGIRLFNDREFYAAHEVIEHEWHAERRPVRRLYQGILQIGVGFLHVLRGNHRGALLLLEDGMDKASDFSPRCLGIDVRRLVQETRVCLDRLRALGPEGMGHFDQGMIPLVHLETAASARRDAHD